ncbi:hypothetical protein CGMCC3_g17709 [Colletotrichum fructicola]|nr:uncharacterized protein CGMCC3_g17709 [Colletotrichum fructicola]KAE9566122.1 hypothetical protein CGMCC3_g17709 [Colletotrichum fructicola]
MRPTSSPIWTRGLSRRNGSCRGHRCVAASIGCETSFRPICRMFGSFAGGMTPTHIRTLVKRGLTKSRERPIIFVVHSLGGIVVKSALIHSDTALYKTPTPLGQITVVPRASAVKHRIEVGDGGEGYKGTNRQRNPREKVWPILLYPISRQQRLRWAE